MTGEQSKMALSKSLCRPLPTDIQVEQLYSWEIGGKTIAPAFSVTKWKDTLKMARKSCLYQPSTPIVGNPARTEVPPVLRKERELRSDFRPETPASGLPWWNPVLGKAHDSYCHSICSWASGTLRQHGKDTATTSPTMASEWEQDFIQWEEGMKASFQSPVPGILQWNHKPGKT